MKKLGTTTLLASVVLFSGCEDDLIGDSSFDLWCGDSLCSWTTDAGSIERVPTWHERDYGVSLVETPTVVSQWVDASGGECLRFSVVADVAAEAQVALELDFYDDGIIDHAQPIPGVRWQILEFLVKLPEEGPGSFRLIIHKQGRGRAVFSDLSAEFDAQCFGAPVEPRARGNGIYCDEDAQCASGVCASLRGGGAVCGECQTDGDCELGSICGYTVESDPDVPGFGEGYRACVPAGEKALGDPCQYDGECGSDTCATTSTSFGTLTCGSCSTDADCSAGEVCGLSSVTNETFARACEPANADAPLAPCAIHTECASGRCAPSILVDRCDEPG